MCVCVCVTAARAGRVCQLFFSSSALETVYRCLYDRRLLPRPAADLPARRAHNSFSVYDSCRSATAYECKVLIKGGLEMLDKGKMS